MRRFLRTTTAVALPGLFCAAAAFASEGGGNEALQINQILWELGIKFLDVAIIAFFAYKFLSKPLAQAMENRSAAVRRALEEATASRRDAEARLLEVQEKNARLENEIQQLVDQTAVDIERELAILSEEARAGAERIQHHAVETIRQEVVKARAELHREAALLAVRIATENVRTGISSQDQRRLVDEYLEEMEAAR